MKVIFLIYRLNYYRFFSPLIQEGLNRGYEIECWHDYSQPRTGKKGYNFPDIKDIPSFKGSSHPKIRIFFGGTELENLLFEHKEIYAVFSIHMSYWGLRKEIVLKLPFRWVTIMTGADSFFEFKQTLSEEPEPNDKEIFFVYSEDWLKKGRAFLKIFYPQYSDFLDGKMKHKVAGNPEFDAFKMIDQSKVREKYKIPENKQILLYLPFPYDNRNKNSSWEKSFCGMFTDTAINREGIYLHHKRRSAIRNFVSKAYSLYQIAKDPVAWDYWQRGINEERVFMSVREFCDRNNLHLVVKPRLKFPVVEIIKENSDLVVWDDETQQGPTILKELLSVAKLTVSFFSSSVLTSVAAGVFHLNIRLPEVFFDNERQKFWISDEAPSFFNFNGACSSWQIEDVIDKLKNGSLDIFTIKSKERAEYMKKYLGFDDFNSSQRIFDELS